MKIHSLLLKSDLKKLQEGYNNLRRDMSCASSPEVVELNSSIEKRIGQVEELLGSLNGETSRPNSVIVPDYTKAFRTLKLDFRFSVRKWRRVVSGEARTRRGQRKGAHVSTIAA